MDAELLALLHKASTPQPPGQAAPQPVSPDSESQDSVTFEVGGQMVEHKLKPLSELYGKGLGDEADPQAECYMPLFMDIEHTILAYYDEHPELTDGTVSMTLDRLAIRPDAPPGSDELAAYIQRALRLTLSLNDYSKAEVVQALRKINKSVQRHTKSSGHRGYLDFIRYMLGR